MVQMSEYETRAQAWADKFGVRMSLVFTGHRKYFQDDQDTRDTYSITLNRIPVSQRDHNRPDVKASMTFAFGASINDSKRVSHSSGPCWDRAAREANRRGEMVTGNHRSVLPSLYSVLACIEKYEPGTFEQWAGELGYDVDSRKALETYLIVQKQYQQFAALCAGSPEMMSEAQDIQ